MNETGEIGVAESSSLDAASLRSNSLTTAAEPRPQPIADQIPVPAIEDIQAQLKGNPFDSSPIIPVNPSPQATELAAVVPKRLERLMTATRRVAEAFRDEFGNDRKMLPGEVQDPTVAYVIWSSLRNPVSGRGPGETPFTIRDLMANAGYTSMRRDNDLMKKYPDVYHRFRAALTSLSRQEILEMGEMAEPDPDNETLYYRIPTDETGPKRQERLLGLANLAREINPKYK